MDDNKELLEAIDEYEEQDIDKTNEEEQQLYTAYKKLSDTSQGECCCASLGAICCCGL